ncbi:MAG: hypothetical protein FWG42_11835, partial [Clostridiales bacterium]|nr:hypothetical protein [Clostridiales bacterium]
IVVLSDGIRPPKDAYLTAELCGLGQDMNGFLRNIEISSVSGVYVCGCAKRPMKIEEAWADSVAVAKEALAHWRER